MAKSPDDRKVQAPQAPSPKNTRSTQPGPNAPPPEANQAPTQPQAEQAPQPQPAPEAPAPQQPAPQVHQANVDVRAAGGVEPDQQPQDGNTQPPVGLPEPPPVVDRVTVTKQAATFISDGAIVGNVRLTPADTATIEQLIYQKFDAGNQVPEDLAEEVAAEQGLNPQWEDRDGVQVLTISARQA